MEKDNKSPVDIELRDAADQEKKEITPGMIRSVTVTIGNREIPLRYNLRAQERMEEELDMDYADVQTAMGKKKNTRLAIRAIMILGNEGLERAGEQPDLTEEWLTDHIIPMHMTLYRMAVIGAMTKGWYMENEEDSREEQDDILAEIRKKNGSTD